MKTQTFSSYMQEQYGFSGNGALTDFLTRRHGELYLGDHISLNTLAHHHGAPLEIAYYPQITRQVQRMRAWTAQARRTSGYRGSFLYAYATKANFAADVVRTALQAGAHYETSAAADIEIATQLWQQGILPADRLILCNGSKEDDYLAGIRALREAGCTTVIPVLDDPDELAALRTSSAPLRFGVRERAVGNRDGQHPGNDRFGLTASEIDQVAAALADTPHDLVLYHAMIGSQVEDRAHFLAMLRASVANYCRLRQRVPSLRFFDFGGGVPTSGYRLDFAFDYAGFLHDLMACIQTTCAQFGVPEPDLIGEFGRYTVANHHAYLFEIGKTKRGRNNAPDWYMINGSLMVTLPDMLMVPNQQFIVLPLTDWERPLRPVRLAGRRTCDSDDVYPRSSQPPLYLPDTGTGLRIAVFGTGAYQQMIGGMGGVHHCLTPEPPRLTIASHAEQTIVRYTNRQDQAAMMRTLGYEPQPALLPQPAAMPRLPAASRMAS